MLRADYARTPLLVENTGHVVEVPQPDDDGGTLVIGAAPAVIYHLQQWHIHAPAEHVVNGHRADLEIHLVHSDGRDTPRSSRSSPTSSRGSTARAARRPPGCSAPCCGARRTPPGRRPTCTRRPAPRCCSAPARHVFGDNKVTIDKYLTYTGSLTTPPCTGGVGWYLLPQTVITVNPEDVDQLHELIAAFPGYGGYPDNNRPVQPLGTRIVTGPEVTTSTTPVRRRPGRTSACIEPGDQPSG